MSGWTSWLQTRAWHACANALFGYHSIATACSEKGYDYGVSDIMLHSLTFAKLATDDDDDDDDDYPYAWPALGRHSSTV